LFRFDIGGTAPEGTSIPLHGNALDVAFVQVVEDSWTAIVSVDNLHKPGSTTESGEDQVSELFHLNT
jgi:tRNA (guanine-N(7)-)-methyltransferase subunit TRM82